MSYNLGLLGQQSAIPATLIVVGLLWVASVIYTVGRVIFSVFILPGASVRDEKKVANTSESC